MLSTLDTVETYRGSISLPTRERTTKIHTFLFVIVVNAQPLFAHTVGGVAGARVCVSVGLESGRSNETRTDFAVVEL
jgi:hypothetical protein